jgi:phosphate starvation-inducible protein PhoH and related proteins
MSKKKRLKNKKTRFSEPENNQQQPPKDRSPVVHQRQKIDHFLRIINRELTEKQKKFIELAMDKQVKLLLVSGPAGTTKTYLSVLVSLLLMNEKKISDILYVRSIVESADVKMGTLPGEADDKLSPFKRPLIDKLDELLPKEDIQYLIKDNRVEGLPIGYLRGLNWNAKAVIGDELQNCTKKELITMMTRMGEFSKLFMCGDPQQSDIGPRSGFRDIYNLFNDDESKQHGIYTFEFTDDDILRSAIVKFIVKKIKNLS